MKQSRSKQTSRAAGVTLVELLVSITLVSLIATGLLFAMRVGITAMESTNRKVMTNRRTLGVQRILEQQVAGFIPAFALCRPFELGLPGASAVRAPFFQGGPQVLRFVTTYSLQQASRGVPQIVELFPIPNPQGGVRLVVNEFPFTGVQGAGQFCLPPGPDPLTGAQVTRSQPPQPSANSFVLADQLSAVEFSYLEVLPAPINERWVSRWTRLGEWPRAIRIDVRPLKVDPSRLQPTTFIAPIRITRKPSDNTEML